MFYVTHHTVVLPLLRRYTHHYTHVDSLLPPRTFTVTTLPTLILARFARRLDPTRSHPVYYGRYRSCGPLGCWLYYLVPTRRITFHYCSVYLGRLPDVFVPFVCARILICPILTTFISIHHTHVPVPRVLTVHWRIPVATFDFVTFVAVRCSPLRGRWTLFICYRVPRDVAHIFHLLLLLFHIR